MTQGIIIDVAGEAAGTVNVPREFVYTKIDPTPPLVTLSTGEVATTYYWEILSQPVGASAALSSSTAASPTFTPTASIAGTYLIRLTVDGSDQYENATAWKTEFMALRIPAVSEGSLYGSRGWDTSVQGFLRELDLFGALDVTDYEVTLYEAVNDGNPQFRIGSANANEGHIQAVYDSGAQTLDYLLISTDSAADGDLVLNPAGNVGINTTSPECTLDIATSTVAVSPSTGGDDLVIRNAGNCGLTILSGNTNDGKIIWGDADDNDVAWIFYDHANNSFSFRTNATGDRLVIDSSGNIGINTSSPTGKFEVVPEVGGYSFVGRDDGDTTNVFTVDDDGFTAAGNVVVSSADSSFTADTCMMDYYSGDGRIIGIGPDTTNAGNLRLVTMSTDASVFNTVIYCDKNGDVGIGEINPETLTEWSGAAPYLTLHNTTEEDSDGGRESVIQAFGEQSGGEETTLVKMLMDHNGASDDEKGRFRLYVNDGSDGDSPTLALTIDDTLDATFAGDIKLNNAAQAITTETLSHYVTIKDSTGATVKLAVVS